MSIFKKHRKIKESSISGREKEYTREELNDIEKKLYDYLRSNKFYEYGDVEQSDNDLADMRIIMTIENGDWKHDHLYADQLIQDFCKENNLAIIKHIKKEIGYSDSDSYSAEHTWYILDDSTGKMSDTIKGFKRLFEPVESLKESELYETAYGKDELWNQINNSEYAYNKLHEIVKHCIEKEYTKSVMTTMVRKAIYSMKDDFGRIPTTQEERAELAKDFVEDELSAYSYEESPRDDKPYKNKGVYSLKEEAIGTTDVVPEPAKDGEDTIVANFVIAAISDEWEAIDGYNELLSVLTQYNQPDLISTIKDIVAEEMTHVGQLEKCLETISPNVSEIESGKEEAEQEIQEN